MTFQVLLLLICAMEHIASLLNTHPGVAREESSACILTFLPFFRSMQDCPPPYFSSNQRLVGPPSGTPRLESAAENPGVQVRGRLSFLKVWANHL